MSDNRNSSQQDLPRVRLYDCFFDDDIEFNLSGLMSLIRCEFKGDYGAYLNIEKSQNEPEITEETLRNLSFNEYSNRIEFIQTKIDVRYLQIYVKSNVARCLKMENVDLDVRYGPNIYIGEEGHDWQKVSVFELEMINCRVSGHIEPYLTFPNSFAKFRFENTVFERIVLSSEHFIGLASYVFDNCTFTNAPSVEIQRFADFKILQSVINVPNDCDGTEGYVRLTGVDDDNLMSDRKLSNIFLNRTRKHYFQSFVDIESTSFQVGHGPFFIVHQAHLRFNKIVFHIQSHRTRHEYLIDFQGIFQSKDVLINLISTDKDLLQVNIMSAVAHSMYIQNTQIICPFGMDALEIVPISSSESHVFHCQAVCTSDMYTFQSGNMILDLNYYYYYRDNKKPCIYS